MATLVDSTLLAPTVRCEARHTPVVKKLIAILRSRGGMLTLLGVICVLVGPSIGTISAAASNAVLEIVGVLILLAGYHTITLWTNDVLVAARRIYIAAGFKLIREEKHHSFGRDLVAQTWEMPL